MRSPPLCGGLRRLRLPTRHWDATFPTMKTLLLSLIALPVLALAGCGDRDDGCCGKCHSDKTEANKSAAAEAEKSFDKEAPAQPPAK